MDDPKHARADKLVSLFHNLRLIARMRKPGYTYTEPAVAWTDSVDQVGITSYGVANYSLK